MILHHASSNSRVCYPAFNLNTHSNFSVKLYNLSLKIHKYSSQ